MYVAQTYWLTPERLASALAYVQTLDLTPGPGGSRIVPAPGCDDILGGVAKVVALSPSCQLVQHCDPPIRGTRHHIPLRLNPDCWVFHDGVWQQLEVGRAYLMDQERPHGAVNWGATVRWHLMIDDGEIPSDVA